MNWNAIVEINTKRVTDVIHVTSTLHRRKDSTRWSVMYICPGDPEDRSVPELLHSATRCWYTLGYIPFCAKRAPTECLSTCVLSKQAGKLVYQPNAVCTLGISSSCGASLTAFLLGADTPRYTSDPSGLGFTLLRCTSSCRRRRLTEEEEEDEEEEKRRREGLEKEGEEGL